jgi:hypothetical protein
MTIQEAHIDFKLKWDKVDNKYNRNFTDEEVDWLLNDAQLAFIRTRFNPSNVARAGFESNTSRLNELSNIHIQFPEEAEIVTTPIDYDYYKVSIIDLSTLSKKYLYLTSILAYNVTCKKWVVPLFKGHETYLDELKNPFNKEVGVYNINGDLDTSSIYLYGDFSKVRISYLMNPERVFLGTYKHPFINSLVPVDFSLPEHTHSIIVDMAVNFAKGISTTNYDNKELVNVLA